MWLKYIVIMIFIAITINCPQLLFCSAPYKTEPIFSASKTLITLVRDPLKILYMSWNNHIFPFSIIIFSLSWIYFYQPNIETRLPFSKIFIHSNGKLKTKENTMKQKLYKTVPENNQRYHNMLLVFLCWHIQQNHE